MAKLAYDVKMRGADNGVIVEVGCKVLVFKETEVDEFLADLKSLLVDGESKVRAKYFPEEKLGHPYGHNIVGDYPMDNRPLGSTQTEPTECVPGC